jgi:hypothetical protein
VNADLKFAYHAGSISLYMYLRRQQQYGFQNLRRMRETKACWAVVSDHFSAAPLVWLMPEPMIARVNFADIDLQQTRSDQAVYATPV